MCQAYIEYYKATANAQSANSSKTKNSNIRFCYRYLPFDNNKFSCLKPEYKPIR